MINKKIKDDIKERILNSLYENIGLNEARHLNNFKIKRHSDGAKGKIVRSRVHGNAYDIEWEDGKNQTLGRKTITNEKKYELIESDSVKPDEEKNANEKEFMWEDDNIEGMKDKIKDTVNKYMKEKYNLNEDDLGGESAEQEVKKSVKDYVNKEKEIEEDIDNENLVKVKDLKIGDKVKFHKTVVVVRDILKDKVLVSKPEGNHTFSISLFSHEYDDLDNRVEKVDEIEEGNHEFDIYDDERQERIKNKLKDYMDKSETEDRMRSHYGDDTFDEMNDPMLKDGKEYDLSKSESYDKVANKLGISTFDLVSKYYKDEYYIDDIQEDSGASAISDGNFIMITYTSSENKNKKKFDYYIEDENGKWKYKTTAVTK